MRVAQPGSCPQGKGKDLCCLPSNVVSFPLGKQSGASLRLEGAPQACTELDLLLDQLAALQTLVIELHGIASDACTILEIANETTGAALIPLGD